MMLPFASSIKMIQYCQKCVNPVIHFWLKSRKVRKLESQKVRESQRTLLKRFGGNLELENFVRPVYKKIM